MKLRIIPDIVENQDVCTLLPENTAYEAARTMIDNNIAAIVINNDQGEMAGIVTERDLTRRVVAESRNAKEALLRDIMTKNPDYLSPSDTAFDALDLMRTRGYRHLPVVEGGRVVGMVSIRDLYAAVKVNLEQSIRETEAFVFGDRYGA